MKACIVGAKNLRHLTLTTLYTDIFKKYSVEYDIVYPDYYGIDEPWEANKIYKIPYIIEGKDILQKRLCSFALKIRYIYFVYKILHDGKYDFVVLWGDESAAMMSHFMKKWKYSVNIRDLWEDERLIYNSCIKKAVKNSAFNTVSSDAFIEHLPAADYLFVHSANISMLNTLKPTSAKKSRAPLVLTYIGAFRNDEYCFRLVRALANDDRFEVKFIGQNSEKVERYANENNIRNVVTIGSFDPAETMELLEDTDIMNCAFGAENTAETTKLPIRFYYAVYMGIPMLVSAGTNIQKSASLMGAGIEIFNDFEDQSSVADWIFDTYQGMDFPKVHDEMNKYKKVITNSHIAFEKVLCKALGIEYKQ